MIDMLTLRRILFPYDFSAQGRQAVPFVQALAKAFDALVRVVSVVPPAFDSAPPSMEPRLRIGDDPAEWRASLQSRLDQALVEEFAGLRVERSALGGDPAFRISEMAQQVDLIMMPTHGVGLFRRLLVGSVTSKVLHDAACPVWTAAHAETQTASELPRNILCAVDRTEQSAAVVKWAADFSAHVGARLRLLHVVDPISDWPSLETERRLQDKVREDAYRAVVSMLESARVEAPLRVAVGEIVSTITEEAREESTDLLIIGRGSVSEPFGGLRTSAFGIVQSSPCPVVSVVV